MHTINRSEATMAALRRLRFVPRRRLSSAFCVGLLATTASASSGLAQTVYVQPLRSQAAASGTVTLTNHLGCVSGIALDRSVAATSHQPGPFGWVRDDVLWTPSGGNGGTTCWETDMAYQSSASFVAPLEQPNTFRLECNADIHPSAGRPGLVTQSTAIVLRIEFLVTAFCEVHFDHRPNCSTGVSWGGASGAITLTGAGRFYGPIGGGAAATYRIDQSTSFGSGQNAFTFPGAPSLLPGLYRLEVTSSANGNATGNPNGNGSLAHAAGATVALQVTGPGVVPSWADVSGDGVVTPADLIAWLASPSDVTGDGVLDTSPYGGDAATLAAILQGQGNLGDDCDDNGFTDAYDIAVFSATSGALGQSDADTNGVPDACESLACDSIDFNNDGLFPDNQDLQDFLSVFGGGVCGGQTPTDPPCNTDIDFNNDGLFPDNEDIISLFRVFGGGAC